MNDQVAHHLDLHQILLVAGKDIKPKSTAYNLFLISYHRKLCAE